MRPIWCLLALPILAGAAARADDAPTPAPAAKPPVETPIPASPNPATPNPAKPDGEAKPPADAKPAAPAISWIHDYDEAKTKAASEKKGLFVYMTPSWFT